MSDNVFGHDMGDWVPSKTWRSILNLRADLAIERVRVRQVERESEARRVTGEYLEAEVKKLKNELRERAEVHAEKVAKLTEEISGKDILLQRSTKDWKFDGSGATGYSGIPGRGADEARKSEGGDIAPVKFQLWELVKAEQEMYAREHKWLNEAAEEAGCDLDQVANVIRNLSDVATTSFTRVGYSAGSVAVR